jgi:hypothetical protein
MAEKTNKKSSRGPNVSAAQRSRTERNKLLRIRRNTPSNFGPKPALGRSSADGDVRHPRHLARYNRRVIERCAARPVVAAA